MRCAGVRSVEARSIPARRRFRGALAPALGKRAAGCSSVRGRSPRHCGRPRAAPGFASAAAAAWAVPRARHRTSSPASAPPLCPPRAPMRRRDRAVRHIKTRTSEAGDEFGCRFLTDKLDDETQHNCYLSGCRFACGPAPFSFHSSGSAKHDRRQSRDATSPLRTCLARTDFFLPKASRQDRILRRPARA